MRKRLIGSIVILTAIIGVFFNPSASLAQSTTKTSGTDLMIICAHPGDEYLFLGGALSLYAGEQERTTVVIYLSSSSEEQRAAAKAGLARLGSNITAVFGPYSDVYTATEEDALRYWNKSNVTAFLVSLIRKYEPAVVVSHDQAGEYGHGANCVTSDCALLAVRAAAEENQYPTTSSLYGSWQVQRLFLHRYGDDQVVLDRSQPLSRFDGKTALTLDQEGYQCYPDPYPIIISDEPGYTKAQYGLAYAAEGDSFDSSSGDLFAGLDDSALTPAATPLPAAAVSPDATAQQKQTQAAAVPTPAPATASQQNAAESIAHHFGTDQIMLVLFGMMSMFAVLWVFLARKKGELKQISLLPTAMVVILFLFFAYRVILSSLADKPVTGELVSAQQEVETPTPSDSGASATPAEAVEATPTPDSWDQYFRSDSDPAEVVLSDPENEHWEYRSDTLSIIIDRVHILRSDGKPQCYCIAHIRMREEDAFQAGIRTDSVKAIKRLEAPWLMARRYRAVLAITGDNLSRSETELKGILIRNGTIYSSNQAQDTLALYSDELTMKVYKPNTITPQELLDQGVVNTFSFGPTLLLNGERDLTSKRGNLGRANPRCGIGMVEPGHFVAITVDGRQTWFSVGMTIDEFAQLFYLNGCQLAYNLDGGSSTAMVFMGENLNQHSGEGSDMQRPWTDGLLWGNSELVPTVDDPIYNDGSKPWRMPPTSASASPTPTAAPTPSPTAG